MKVKMILPAPMEATSRHFRPIKDSFFWPLGLERVAGYLSDDELFTPLNREDEPDLVF